jgi:hypothetical protein
MVDGRCTMFWLDHWTGTNLSEPDFRISLRSVAMLRSRWPKPAGSQARSVSDDPWTRI